jgi:hypothetical protein
LADAFNLQRFYTDIVGLAPTFDTVKKTFAIGFLIRSH